MKLPTKVGSALQADRLNRVESIVPEVAWQFRREPQSQICRRQKPEWVGDFFTAEAQRTPRDGRGGARPYRSSGIESRGLVVPANPTRHKRVVVNFTILEKRVEEGCDFWDKGRMQGLAWLLGMAIGLGLSGCGKKGESVPQAAAEASAKRTDDLPTDPEEKYKTAYVRSAQAFSRNDLEGAIKFLDIADQAKPGQANTANLRGAIYTRQRDWPKAQLAFEEALKLQSDLPMAQFNLGEVLFLNNKYKEARERFQIFLNSQPKNDLGLYKIYLCSLS